MLDASHRTFLATAPAAPARSVAQPSLRTLRLGVLRADRMVR